MTNVAISAQRLSKAYRIGLSEQRHETLAGAAAAVVKAPFRNFRSLRRQGRIEGTASSDEDIFWALKDVSFDVAHGEAIGIIGRNGAGKSTLLKILSRITEPTSGRATIYGRVASLLEVGTGFHPDLTGRENVYLNGTLLGMRKREIDSKFDEIVGFSEVEQFIDTPVKRYSSGMRVRLAFAVAAHLEPEILVIDEVLAVGDAEFQKRCLGKMQDVATQGRTVLFVSHNMSAVLELCSRSIVLDKGSILFSGRPADGIEKYMESSSSKSDAAERNSRSSLLSRVRINDGASAQSESGEAFEVGVTVGDRLPAGSWLFFIMEDFVGRTVFHKRVSSSEITMPANAGSWQLTVSVPSIWPAAGLYSIYFKVLVAGVDGGSQRATSEKVLLEITGELDNSGKAILNPSVTWRASLSH